MNIFFNRSNAFFTVKNKLLKTLCLLFSLLFVFLISACKNELDYFNYVSELRQNIFLAETEAFSLRIFSVRKESPYAADGIPKECTDRTEVYLTAPDGVESCHLTFTVNGKEFGGDMSFDNVKTEYYFSCTLDSASENKLACRIRYGDTETEIIAHSVRTNDTLSARAILQILQAEEKELFPSLTDKYGFAGEIYLRLIYEDAPYYYVGVIDRNGMVNAYLLNAKTGKLLAKRKS